MISKIFKIQFTLTKMFLYGIIITYNKILKKTLEELRLLKCFMKNSFTVGVA